MLEFIIHKDEKMTIKEGHNIIQRYTQILTQKLLQVIFLSKQLSPFFDLSIGVFLANTTPVYYTFSSFLASWTGDTTHYRIVHLVR